MKPKRVTAWACGNCGKVYQDRDDPNLERCCTSPCPECGKASADYIGGSYLCAVCSLKDCLRFNREQVANTQKTIAEQEKRLKELQLQEQGQTKRKKP
jgi:hypothetical protein